ncbi:MAG: dipeptidase [Spirochaetales bacterium]
MKKFFTVLLAVMLIALQGAAACTIFAVSKGATADGITITSHTCDSTGDDLRVWVIPSFEAGERDLVLDGRAGADYSKFPAVRDYGSNGMVLGTLNYEKPTNQYLHGMYSFINDKGVSMNESTCWYWTETEQDNKLSDAFARDEGIVDCYMLQDYALETCSTAREAVEKMGALVEEYGWYGTNSCECVCVGDGNEAWAMEFYGGKIWVAVRVPEGAVFVCANRARINHFDFNDPENYLCSANIKEFAVDNGLWDGKSDFIPCRIFCPRSDAYSVNREWSALTQLNPNLNINRLDPDHDINWPLFVYPAEPVTVDKIYRICSSNYEGTEIDVTRTIEAGAFGNPLNSNNTLRTINCYRCTYIQITAVDASLPEEARCLAYFGWGAPISTYLTPVFASQKSLPSFFGRGMRDTYDPESGWWLSEVVQMQVQRNFKLAIEDVRAARDAKMASVYQQTRAAQEVAASMIELGQKDAALDFLTSYANSTATNWFQTWQNLSASLEAKYALGNVNMKVPREPDAWRAVKDTVLE